MVVDAVILFPSNHGHSANTRYRSDGANAGTIPDNLHVVQVYEL